MFTGGYWWDGSNYQVKEYGSNPVPECEGPPKCFLILFLNMIPKFLVLALFIYAVDGAQQVWFHMQISLWAPIKIYQAYDTWHGFFDPRIQWLSAVLGSHPHFKTNSKLLVIYPIHINLVTSKEYQVTDSGLLICVSDPTLQSGSIAGPPYFTGLGTCSVWGIWTSLSSSRWRFYPQ